MSDRPIGRCTNEKCGCEYTIYHACPFCGVGETILSPDHDRALLRAYSGWLWDNYWDDQREMVSIIKHGDAIDRFLRERDNE
jgi:hypothetical protein